MLHEQASSERERPHSFAPHEEAPSDPQEAAYRALLSDLHEIVADVLIIETQTTHIDQKRRITELMMAQPDNAHVVTFGGQLVVDSAIAYDLLDAECATRDLIPLLRREKGVDYIHIFTGRAAPAPRAWVPNLVLFVLTLLSVLYVGTQMAINEIAAENLALGIQLARNLPAELWRGLPYALGILLILGAHELGHYFAARRHRLAVTLPYFIPFPLGLFGTFGAFIQLREPIKSRRMLIDVGAAGPLAGLVFAVPILFIGLATSQTGPITSGLVEGNSLFYALAKFLVFGEWLPNAERDVFVNQLAWAGWTGLFVTGLNLIPVGQLDGGHVLYSLLGKHARLVFYPAIIGLALLTVATRGALIFILILLLLFGRTYAVPLDDITPLDARRRLVGIVTLMIFVLVFVPVPITQVTVTSAPAPALNGDGLTLLTVALGVVLALRQRVRARRWLSGRI